MSKKLLAFLIFSTVWLGIVLFYIFFSFSDFKIGSTGIEIFDSSGRPDIAEEEVEPPESAAPAETSASFTEIGSVTARLPVAGPSERLSTAVSSTETGAAAVSKAVQTPAAATSSSVVSIVSEAKIIKLDVPFTAQAPFGEWSDMRQENACEEAAAVMAVYWARGQSLTLQKAKDEIIAISDWEQKNYGFYEDTSASDTVDRIFNKYFGFQGAEAVNNISLQDIIDELSEGNLVIVPVNGRKLGNPFFTPPGPVEHMVVIIGYDYGTKEFIVNESGTRRGKDYRYDQAVLYEAIRDYPSGLHEPITGVYKNMIIVKK